MTLSEAIRSGKRFKRPCHVCWIEIEDEKMWLEDARTRFSPVVEDVGADDWFTEPVKKELSRDEIICAVHRALPSFGQEGGFIFSKRQHIAEQVCEIIGL